MLHLGYLHYLVRYPCDRIVLFITILGWGIGICAGERPRITCLLSEYVEGMAQGRLHSSRTRDRINGDRDVLYQGLNVGRIARNTPCQGCQSRGWALGRPTVQVGRILSDL